MPFFCFHAVTGGSCLEMIFSRKPFPSRKLLPLRDFIQPENFSDPVQELNCLIHQSSSSEYGKEKTRIYRKTPQKIKITHIR